MSGYKIRTDVHYDPLNSMWVERVGEDTLRVGFDPLGVEINGTLAQVMLGALAEEVSQGSQVGSLEAEKFVGPIPSPVSGVVSRVNEAVIANPGVLHVDPYEGWLFELSPFDDVQLQGLLSGPELKEAFAAKVVQYKVSGVLAQ